MSRELEALRAVDFNWTHALQGIWTDPTFQVEELHRATHDAIIDDFLRETKKITDNPIGRVILGEAGAGKTHLIGTLRRRVWEAGGWFLLIDIIGISDFWETTAHCFVTSLLQPMPDGRTQYRNVLSRIAKQALSASAGAKAAEVEPPPNATKLGTVDLFLKLLRRTDPMGAIQHQDVVRALILLESDDMDVSNFALCWLQGLDVDEAMRRELKFMSAPPAHAKLVRGMLWVMSLAGPVLIAIDQIDAVIGAFDANSDDEAGSARRVVETLAGGLMDLHDIKRRAMTVVSCLQATWPILRDRAVKSAAQRFRELTALKEINHRALAERLIAGRVGAAYAEVGFQPPYPTWPFRPEAIDSAVGLLPRQILIRCENHRQACWEKGEAFECASLETGGAGGPANPEPRDHALDAVYHGHREAADVAGFLARDDDDLSAADLLLRACELLLGHFRPPESLDAIVKRDPNKKKPSLHARLVFVFHDQGDREQHFGFRALGHANPIAFQSRLKAAMTEAGLDTTLKFRRLFILRRGAPPGGAKTKQLVEQFVAAGGEFLSPSDEDWRALLALRAMAASAPLGFESWLLRRKPLFETALFKAAGLAPPPFLAEAPPAPPVQQAPPPAPVETIAPPPRPTPPVPPVVAPEPPLAPVPPAAAAPPPAKPAAPRALSLGRRLERGVLGEAVVLPVERLSSHVAILAGTGAGKTVLLRRMIEEAALAGVPAIVLDVNNDLSRLGDPWPARPDGFSGQDAEKAEAYRARAEVVIWTPGVSGGAPLSLNLLPDFAAIGVGGDPDSRDDRDQAVEMALATLEPYVAGGGQRAGLRKGVLADALRLFAGHGGGSLEDLARLLGDLPEEASAIGDAGKLGQDIADQLRAAVATNPLLRSSGPPLDPGRLFEGAAGKTRISVLNLSGLAGDTAKQAFVNQLQMTLFTWIKRHPSPTGRLYVLDEAQNYAPSLTSTPCKRGTLALVAQARKYGLGMIFATQQPRGLDNTIVSNAATHVYGRMSSPASINATREMMAARGGAAEDLGRLGRGEFYFSGEGASRPVKIKAPLCLSWHSATPPTAAEIVQKARAGVGPVGT